LNIFLFGVKRIFVFSFLLQHASIVSFIQENPKSPMPISGEIEGEQGRCLQQ